jgi:hypothetical protein
MPTPVLDHEAPVLAKLERSPTASDLPVQARALHFPVEDGATLVALTAQLPASAATARADKSGSLEQDLTVMALVRDAKGRVVHKASRQYRLTWPKTKADALQREKLLFEREATLTPGRYVVQVIAYDALSGKAGVTRTDVVIPRRPAGALRLGSLVIVGRTEPNALGDPGPLHHDGPQIYPNFGESVSTSGGKPVSFVLAATPGTQPPTTARAELLLGDEPLRGVDVPLPAPEGSGQLRVAGSVPVDGLPPGAYTLRVVISDGRSMESRTADLMLAR